MNYKLKGSQVELLGEESEEGSKVYKIKLTDKFSEVTYYFIDTSSFLFLKEISQRIVTGEAYDVETSYEDYKKVDKVMFAHSIKELNLTDRTRKVEIVTIKIEINPPVADVLFSMPK